MTDEADSDAHGDDSRIEEFLDRLAETDSDSSAVDDVETPIEDPDSDADADSRVDEFLYQLAETDTDSSAVDDAETPVEGPDSDAESRLGDQFADDSEFEFGVDRS
ncbi:MAG: hypothetical protein ACOC0Z_02105, partial [Halohasta sp.]